VLRGLFLLLVLANLVFFAWSAGYLGRAEDGREPERLRDQYQPELLKVAVLDEVKRAAATACRRVEPVAPATADQFKAEWEAKGVQVDVQPIDENVYLVLIAGLTDKPSLERKLAELRRLGVRDTYSLPDHAPGTWAISLGSFRDENSARTHLSHMSQRGVRSAKVEMRSKASGKVRLELTGDADRLSVLPIGLLPAIAAEVAACPAK
jgi:hypothetical protein